MAGLTALHRARARARAALWAERLARALWPAATLAGLFAGWALLDGPRWAASVHPWAPITMLAMTAAAFLVLASRAFRLRRPTPAEADRRIEAASGLAHQPLATLQDQPAAGAPGLWQAHVQRVAAGLGRLRTGPIRPGIAVRDRFAVRGALVVGLGAALIVAGPDAPGRLWRALTPSWPGSTGTPIVVQAWLRPPAYTGLPPRPVTGTTLVAPIGSRLIVNVTGSEAAPALLVNAKPEPFLALDRTSFQAERTLTAPGPMQVRRRGQVLAAWTVTIVPDAPPTAQLTEPPAATQGNARATPQLRLVWEAADDYGLASITAELRLVARPAAPPAVVTLPAPRGRTAHGTTITDLTAHPWAGLPVMVQVVARDALDQAGRSAAAPVTLPERIFRNALARSIVTIRRDLSLLDPADADARHPALSALDAVADDPAWATLPPALAMNLRAAAAQLEHGHEPNTIEEAQARLWALALTLEEDALDRTGRAVAEAEQAVQEAMSPDASPEVKAELEARIEALRDAINHELQALAELPREQLDRNRPVLTPRELNRSADKLQDAVREGRMDDARQLMAELERQLEQLQNARPGDAQQDAQRQAGQQQMQVVQDILKRQLGLLDSATARGGNPGSPPADRAMDERRQRALRRVLGEMMQQYGDLTGQVPAPLGEADTAMRDAAMALAQQMDVPASAAQQKAMDALQKGAQSMSQQLALQFGDGEGDGEGDEGEGQQPGTGTTPGPGRSMRPGGRQPGSFTGRDGRTKSTARDPLGRNTGVNGSLNDGDVRVPDQMEAARGRAIQDELRHRGQDRNRPRPELDYIDRLLAPFQPGN